MNRPKDPYRPLPSNLTIKESEIEGLGLFAAEDIPSNTYLGISHYYMVDVGIIRTPMGGFYNHSDNPNCKKQEINFRGNLSVMSEYHLYTLRDIKEGEEITVNYTFYDSDRF